MPKVAQIVRRRRIRAEHRQRRTQSSQVVIMSVSLVVMLFMILPAFIVFGYPAWVYFQSITPLPQPQEVSIQFDRGETALYDRTGATRIYLVQAPTQELGWVSISDLPDYVSTATVQVEDPDYYEVTQFRPDRYLAQFWSLQLGGEREPSSPIINALIENNLIPYVQEAPYSQTLSLLTHETELQRIHSSNDLLEWYLNTAYYGNNAYGIEAAAQTYFAKSATQLTLDEAVLLANIPPSPQFNPVDNETVARENQLELLRQMVSNNMINERDYNTAVAQPIRLQTENLQTPEVAPHFSEYAYQQAIEILNTQGLDGRRLIAEGDIRITTTLDVTLYHQTECMMRSQLNYRNNQEPVIQALDGSPCATDSYLTLPLGIDTTSPPTNGQAVLIHVPTGEIHAIVGDVFSAQHQPAITLHPFVYTEGLRLARYTPASMVLDIPQQFPGPAEGLLYTPTNINNTYSGVLNLRDAMASNLLPPAVTIANDLGVDYAMSIARRIGISSLPTTSVDLSILERGENVSVLDVAYAYSVFADLGTMNGIPITNPRPNERVIDPVAVLRIENERTNEILWEYLVPTEGIVFDQDLGYIVNDILSDQLNRSLIWSIDTQTLDIERPAALVTGVASNQQDAWTVGYTPEYVFGVHFNRVNSESMTIDNYSLKETAPVWQAVMNLAHEVNNVPPQGWQRPSTIVEYAVCERSGMIPSARVDCPTRNELFLSTAPPIETDTFWREVEINTQTGQLATANTPAGLKEQQLYFIPPDIALEWWVDNGNLLPPRTYDTISSDEGSPVLEIIAPESFGYIGGVYTIQADILATDFAYYQLSYGPGLNPEEWLLIGDPQFQTNEAYYQIDWSTNGLDGIYTLRLSLVYEDDRIENQFAQVTIDNQSPSITLTSGEMSSITQPDENATIPLQAEVLDNLAVSRVEFYVNNILLGSDEQFPYGFEFEVERTGTETITAIVYDQVGNQASDSIKLVIDNLGEVLPQ